MNSFRRITILHFLALCACLAQSGFVKSGGQAIPGATITITQQSQTLSTVTDSDGHYTFPPLAPGAWSVTVDMFGFNALSKSVDYSAIGETAVNFDLELKPSPLLQRMQQMRQNGQGAGGGRNAAGAQGTQMDQQIQNEMNTQQSAERAPSTASGGSNESFLVSGSLSPGLSQDAQADSGPDVRFGQTGGAADAAGNPAGSPFGQQGGNAGGGFGGGGFGGGGFGGGGRGGPGGPGSGGGRGGRPGQGPGGQFGNFRRRNQQIRGQASFSLQNSALNAKPFSLNGLDIPQASYAQSRFSLIVGGPLVIPKIVKDPSTQFFLTYFGTRGRTPRLFTETVPTAAERNGDFSQATQSLGTNATSVPVQLPFANNVIPAQDLNPIAVALLKRFYPLPNQPGNANNYQFETAQPNNTDNVGFRIQRSVTKKDRLFFNIQFQRRDSNTAQAFGYTDAVSGYGLTNTLGWTRNLSTNVISNLQFRFSRNRNQVTPYFSTLNNVAAQLGIPGTSSNPLNYGPPTLNFTNFASLSDSVASLSRNQSQGFTEALSVLRGVHSLSFGGGYTRPIKRC